MGFIAVSESTPIKNNFYFSLTFFASLGIGRQSIKKKLGSDPYLGPIRAQTLPKKILNESKSYLL